MLFSDFFTSLKTLEAFRSTRKLFESWVPQHRSLHAHFFVKDGPHQTFHEHQGTTLAAAAG